MDNVIENNLDFNEMLNIIFHGFTHKVTLSLGIPSVVFGFIAGGGWLAFVMPIVLGTVGCVKYGFDIKASRARIKREELEIRLLEQKLDKKEKEDEGN